MQASHGTRGPSVEVVATKELAGQVAVVTGSGSGIGRATALELAAAGAAVVLHARRNRAGAEEVAAAITRLGSQAEVMLVDLAEPRGQDELVARAWDWRGRVSIWVNNAGVDVLTGPGAGLSFEGKLDALWKVDVAATVRLSRQVGQRMKAVGSGLIVNIGWDGVDHGMAGDTAELFAAAKGAVMGFSRSLAQSLAPEVRVNCLAPGWIRTAWGSCASEYWQRRAERESLAGRWGTPEDVAAAVRMLASPGASFINGQTIAVNGGRHQETGPHS